MVNPRAASSLVVTSSLAFCGCAFLFDTQSLQPEPSDAGLTYRELVLADGPKAYFRFGDAVGTTSPKDEVSRGPSAGISGGVTFGAKGLIAGDADGAATFDGSSGVCFLGTAGDFDFSGNAPFTLEAWIAPAVFDAVSRRLFANEEHSGVTTSGASGWQGYFVVVQDDSSGGVSFVRASDGALCGDGNKGVVFGKDTIHHVVAVYTGSASRLFVDGRLQSVPTCNPSNKVNGTLGVGGPGTNFQGVIDEIAIYDKALSDAQVKAHYEKGKAP